MRRTRMRNIFAPVALLLVLVCSGARAHGQSDGFFGVGGSRVDEVPTPNGANWGSGYGSSGDLGGTSWGGYGSSGDLGGTSWGGYGDVGGINGALWGEFDEAGDLGGASWGDYQNGTATPVGSGLLVLAASGACYAALRARRKRDGAAD